MPFELFGRDQGRAKEKIAMIIAYTRKIMERSNAIDEIVALHSILEKIVDDNDFVSKERAMLSFLLKQLRLYIATGEKKMVKSTLKELQKYIAFIKEEELCFVEECIRYAEIENTPKEQVSLLQNQNNQLEVEKRNLEKQNSLLQFRLDELTKEDFHSDSIKKLICLIIADVFLKNQAYVLSGDLIAFLMKEKAKGAALGYNANLLSNIVSIVENNFESIIKPYQEELDRLK